MFLKERLDRHWQTEAPKAGCLQQQQHCNLILYLDVCRFYWAKWMHIVLLWSSFSVQSADQRARANSSGEKEQISPSIWNLNGCPIKQTAGTALYTCGKQLILVHRCLGGSCLDRCQQHRETEDKGGKRKRCS